MQTNAIGPDDEPFSVAIEDADAETRHAIRCLLEPTYWSVGVPARRIDAALERSTVLVVARDRHRSVIGSARALSDYGRRAMIFDVIVAGGFRHRGIGRAMMRLLLDHEALRDTSVIWLATRDKVAFYEAFGFVVLPHASPRPDGNTEMVLMRP